MRFRLRHAFRRRFLLMSILGACSLLVLSAVSPSHIGSGSSEHLVRSYLSQSFLAKPASAQRLGVTDISQRVYDSIPSIPLENEYIEAETGDVATNNTLVSRFIRYHLYVARRSPEYRFDWKISLADYLGVNGWIRAAEYPGGSDLRSNPLSGDVDAIRHLNRSERDALVQELVQLFSTEGGRLPTYLSR
ncbi:MAG: hypothetical protein AAF327_12465 [Cyanobacteria bacterium P01_A01_bin.37]